MGLFGKKDKPPTEPRDLLSAYPVRPEWEYLLTLGAPYLEYYAGENSSLILADLTKGREGKLYYPVWGICNPPSLESAIAKLVDDSFTVGARPGKIKSARKVAAERFGGAAIPGADFSIERISQITDFGGLHLEFVAHLARIEMGISWGTEDHALGLLHSVYDEVSRRFSTWSDYMISAVAASQLLDQNLNFPHSSPAIYLRLLQTGYHSKYPLGQ